MIGLTALGLAIDRTLQEVQWSSEEDALVVQFDEQEYQYHDAHGAGLDAALGASIAPTINGAEERLIEEVTGAGSRGSWR